MLAFHAIFGMYGFWLPNDPRGSWSKWIGSWELFRYGKATKVDTRRSLAHRPHDQRRRRVAKQALKYPPVVLDGHQAKAIAIGLGRASAEHGFTIHACAVLPEHCHLVIAPNGSSPGQIIGQLKRHAGDVWVEARIHPLAAYAQPGERPPLCFVRRGWKVYLDDAVDVRRAIRYVEKNPVKERLRPQRWSMVRSFDPSNAFDIRVPHRTRRFPSGG
jgi:REP element-mobilizing transposase RayT